MIRQNRSRRGGKSTIESALKSIDQTANQGNRIMGMCHSGRSRRILNRTLKSVSGTATRLFVNDFRPFGKLGAT